MVFKILIVDDEYINRRLLISLLNKALYEIETIEAFDGRDALVKTKEHSDIQLILLDIEMPNMDGAEFLKEHKKNEALADVPVIAVSSNDLRIKEILDLGADSFIVKPITEERLLAAIMNTQS